MMRFGWFFSCFIISSPLNDSHNVWDARYIRVDASATMGKCPSRITLFGLLMGDAFAL
jgi:hypothetical protein